MCMEVGIIKVETDGAAAVVDGEEIWGTIAGVVGAIEGIVAGLIMVGAIITVAHQGAFVTVMVNVGRKENVIKLTFRSIVFFR